MRREEKKGESFFSLLSAFPPPPPSSSIFFPLSLIFLLLLSLSLSHSTHLQPPPPSPTPPTPLTKKKQVAARAEEAPVATGKISGKKYSQKGGRWAAIDATNDLSDDQQDITRAAGMVDSLYQGWQGQGTQNAVMSSEEYLSNASRSMNNIEDGYYISPAFLDKLSIHVAKNFLDLPKIKVPLILGIWGGKGQGKTFQCALAYKKLGISPIVMSAGELESGNAGEPAKLIRQRYREASDIIKKGKMCSLFINDLDAGAGRMGGGTQYTVNNQMVNATLMNIADNPTNVQLPGVYKNEEIPRVPVVCTGEFFCFLFCFFFAFCFAFLYFRGPLFGALRTRASLFLALSLSLETKRGRKREGEKNNAREKKKHKKKLTSKKKKKLFLRHRNPGNDFSTLYAPLIRDGRMEKFYWAPTREDRIGVCMGIFQHDGVVRQDVETIVDAFPGQSIDFFGALRARVYDDAVREFVTSIGIGNIGKRLINSAEGKVEFAKPAMTLDTLLEYGNAVVQEQENVKRVQLADAYLAGAELAGAGGTSMPEAVKAK